MQTSMARMSFGWSLAWMFAAAAGSRLQQQAMEISRAAFRRARSQPLSQLIGSLRTGKQAFQQSAQVKAGTANYDWKMFALCNFGQCRARLPRILPGGKPSVGSATSIRWCRNTGAVFARRLGRPDFKVAINSNRVATDDLAGELLGERDGQSGLSRGRWPEDDDQQRIRRCGKMRRHSPRAPGNGLAEPHEGDEQNHQRKNEQSGQLHALARLLALIPLRGSGLLLARCRRF